MRALSIMSGLAVALAAPASMAAPRAAEAAPQAVPESIWQKGDDGSRTHLQSTLQCPIAVGVYHLAQTVAFDGFGFDVACDYRSPSLGSAITLYLTERKGNALQSDFEGAKEAIRVTRPDAQPEDPVGAPSAGAWLSAVYAIENRAMRTGVWVTDIAGWTLKLRVSWPPEKWDAVATAMRDLAGRSARTAQTHLEACARSPAPARQATVIDDKDKLMMLSIVSMLGNAAVDESKGTPVAAAPDQWCAERAIVHDEVPFLLWRNIAPRAIVVDRITPMTVGKPPIFESMINPLATLISGELAQQPGEEALAKGVLHQFIQTTGTNGQIFAFYDGRPDGEALAALAARVLARTAKPVAGYDSATRTLSIYTDN